MVRDYSPSCQPVCEEKDFKHVKKKGGVLGKESRNVFFILLQVVLVLEV